MYSKRKLKNWLWGYFFIAPTIIGLLILNIWPIVQTGILSLSKSMGFNKYIFSGFTQYIKILHDLDVWTGLKNTLVYSILAVPCGIFISLILAWMICKINRAVSIYRTIFFTPMVAAPAAITIVWAWIYNTEYGVLNYLLGFFGADPISWLNNPKYTMLSIVIIAIWGGIGQQLIIMMVAIQNVPKTYYEASDIDGAGDFVKLFKITIPIISPSIFFLTVTGFIAALGQFDMVYMIFGNTSSEAVDSVKTIMYGYYKQAFVIQDKAYASAIAMVTLVIILFFTGIQFWVQKKAVYYE